MPKNSKPHHSFTSAHVRLELQDGRISGLLDAPLPQLPVGLLRQLLRALLLPLVAVGVLILPEGTVDHVVQLVTNSF